MWSLLITTILIESAFGIQDLNCTTGGVYAPNAVSCSNTFSDQACLALYLNASAVTPGGADERPAPCFNGTNGPSQDVKDMAIVNCPKMCGYCCQTPAYSCSNAPYPRVNCATVTQSMCQSTQWRSILAADCPNICGFCLLDGCIDSAPDCSSQPTICVTTGMEAFVAANCQRTCGKCSSTSSSTTSSSPVTGSTCQNTNSNCASWVKNGFCKSAFYTTAQKRQMCGVSCGLCTGK